MINTPQGPKTPGFRPLDEKIFEKKAVETNRATAQDQFTPGEVISRPPLKALKGMPDEPTKGSESAQPIPGKWTVLTYFNGNCDLQSDMESSMKALEGVGSDDKISFVAQIARGSDSGKAQRILLKKPSFLGMKKNSVVMEELGDTNMAHPQTLKDFISWGMRKFPAEHYAVILNGHGMGFIGSLPDDRHDDMLTTPEFKSAMDVAAKETGRKIDILGFDSCLMANAETAHAAKDAADFMVGSEEVLVSGNWDYGEFAGKMKEEVNGDGLTVAEALEAIVKSQYNGMMLTSSIIDLRRMPEFTDKLKNFSDKLLATDTPPSGIKRAFRYAQHYCQPKIMEMASNGDVATKPMDQMRDVTSVALEIMKSPNIKDVELKKAAQDLAKFTVDKVVIFEMHRKNMDLSDSGGISMYAPASDADKYADFYDTKIPLGVETGWGKVIKKFGV